jgi:hypothetical protein
MGYDDVVTVGASSRPATALAPALRARAWWAVALLVPAALSGGCGPVEGRAELNGAQV